MKRMILTIVFITLVTHANGVKVIWQQATTPSITPKSFDLCVRDKWGTFGVYDIVFRVLDPNEKKSYTIIESNRDEADDFNCANFPRDFKGSMYMKGKYTWYAMVNNKLVASDTFRVKKTKMRIDMMQKARHILHTRNICTTINSKGIMIYCTKSMKLCKTEQEVIDF